MKLGAFSKIELPHHDEEAFSSILLGNGQNSKSLEERYPDDSAPDSVVRELLLRAHDRYFRGFYEDGLACYARVLRHDGYNLDGWIGQIRILVDVGRHEAAAYWSDEAAKRLGWSDLLRNAKAFALASGGMIGEAKEIINVPVRADETPMIWLLRGEVFLKIKINFFQRLFTPYKGIGRMGAFFCFLKALSPDPDDSFLNQRVGLAYLLTGDAVLGSKHLRVSLNMAPDNPLTLCGLAQCSRMNHDYKHALFYVKQAIAGNPELDCAFELLQWLHKPRFTNIIEFIGIKGKRKK
jgi:tetratricopeptide (TPR) repeat protein